MLRPTVSACRSARAVSRRPTRPRRWSVAADVWYDQQLAELVSAYLGNAIGHGASVLISDVGDTGRKYFPRTGYRRLAAYELPSFVAIEGRERVTASIWQPSQAARPAFESARGSSALIP